MRVNINVSEMPINRAKFICEILRKDVKDAHNPLEPPLFKGISQVGNFSSLKLYIKVKNVLVK